MRKLTLLILSISILSCRTVELTDGTYITKRRERKIFEQAFNDSFGKMTSEELELMEGVRFEVDTVIEQTTEDINIKDTTLINTGLIVYKELIESKGDTTILYDGELYILNGVHYINQNTTIWIDLRSTVINKNECK
jgi:hypothetical protein